MKIAVIGVGGVGGYYGAVLGRRGHEVSLIARGAHLVAIQANGLQIRSALGDFSIRPGRATDTPAEVGAVDLVLFCTKAYDTASAAEAARPLVGPSTTVVSLQNGLDAREQIGAVLGLEHMLTGMTGIMTSVQSPGIIRMESKSPWITVGELDGKLTPRARAFREAFDGTGVEIEISERIMAELWGKLMIVAPLAAFGSLTRLTVGDYRSIPETRAQIMRFRQEIADLAAAEHWELAADAVEETMAGMDALPPTWKASMQRDVEAGRRSELEATIGVICRKGRSRGIATPVADMLYGSLLPADLLTRAP